MKVMVTTESRGVFFGELIGKATHAKVTLANSRMCIYWAHDARGVFGLASRGPSSKCRISHAVPGTQTLYDITSVTECADEAIAAWEREPWG